MDRAGTKKTTWWIWALVLVLLAGAVTAYLITRQKGEEVPPPEESSELTEERAQGSPADRGGAVATGISEPEASEPMEDEEILAQTPAEALEDEEEPDSTRPGMKEEEDGCDELLAQVKDFFRYLDKKEYVERILMENDTWSVFKSALSKLSANLPAPSGEGLDPAVLTRNVYHFFRVLDGREIQLAKDVLRHEADTLEFNLEMFYRWLTLGDECPDPEGIRPSREALYRYAGFFLNTIGGRSYLFRRAPEARLL
ncbi:MAG: hypothetical protein ACLFUP_06115, partial [Desulfobacteraceae bacterium]